MAGIKISNLPAIVSPATSDVFPISQSGTTYKETVAQLMTFIFNGPTLVTPNIGVATATSIAFSPTTGGIIGTTVADNASAGKVGEFVSSQVLHASPVSLTTTVTSDLTSISLTAGDWDVWGNVGFLVSMGASQLECWINTTSVTAPDGSLIQSIETTTEILLPCNLCVVQNRINVSMTTTVYISANATFSMGTVGIIGGIYARRVR